MSPRQLLLTLGLAGLLPLAALAAPLAITIATPPPAATGYFKLGTTKNPAGQEISVTSRSLLYNGRPVFPVMGEFHYTRCPTNEWRDELLKMKAGGVNIVSTYVFWIHHEEVRGQWDWSGQRDLHQFIKTCGDLGLKVVVRCGPWCHGEVRNGGFPDWVEQQGWKLRSNDPNFLAAVKVLYDQIAAQLAGQLWKDGGPVIGIQVDNEFGGSPDYLLTLKQMAVTAGLDVPLYIKTGWPAMSRPMPLGELLPLFGAYADGFWSRSLQPMDGTDWENYLFKITRTDTGIGADIFGRRSAGDTAGTEQYPYFTCEIGGGMPASYHRRMNLDPRDIEAVALTELGGGSSLMGYYMYHGGQNPTGKLSTLQESLTSGRGGYNDLPQLSYDFNAPLGEYGQVNPQYHWLRRLHLFLHDFGGPLADMPATLPDLLPTNRTDFATLRWSARSDGNAGYVFVNNYQRLQTLPTKHDVQFQLNLPGDPLLFPDRPIDIPAGDFFFWPFNLDLGRTKLVYATAQPVCTVTLENQQIFVFAQTPGIQAEFVFAATNNSVQAVSGTLKRRDDGIHILDVKPRRDVAIRLSQNTSIVLLSDADSLMAWKSPWPGSTEAVLTPANVIFDADGKIRLSANNPRDLQDIYPRPLPAPTVIGPDSSASDVRLTVLRPVGPAREIPLTKGKSPIALAPAESDFTNAAVWKITLSAGLDLKFNPILRINYVGDVARLRLNGRLLDDNFYNGRSFDLGLQRYGPEILIGDLQLEILPLRPDASIYLPAEARANFSRASAQATVKHAEIVQQYGAEFLPAKPQE
jgi:hypothetical protein